MISLSEATNEQSERPILEVVEPPISTEPEKVEVIETNEDMLNRLILKEEEDQMKFAC